jgi:hypothetical protein
MNNKYMNEFVENNSDVIKLVSKEVEQITREIMFKRFELSNFIETSRYAGNPVSLDLGGKRLAVF